MAKEKRYFWLKFKRDFFDDLRIRKLQSIPGGDTYVLAYIKILTYSIPTSGIIVYQGIFETIEEEIALEINEDAKTVRFVLEYASNHGMLEGMEQGKYFLPYAAENIGTETASAVRMRRLRNGKKKLPSSHCDADVTHTLRSCAESVTLETETEIETEIETDTETESDPLFEQWLEEYCSAAKNPPAYRSTMRKKFREGNKDTLVAFSVWKQEYLKNKQQEEEKQQIEEYDYTQLVGMQLGDRTINRVVDTGSMLHLFFDDGTDALNYKQDLYQWIHQKHKEAINQ